MTKVIGPTGYGLMSLSWRADPLTDEQCFAAIDSAIEDGITFFNTGEFYGPPDDPLANLTLIKRYLEKHPENAKKMVISVKGAVDLQTFKPDTSKESLEKSISLIAGILGYGNFIYEPARMDLVHEVEEVMENLIPYVKSGKIQGISLSEVKGDTVRRAAKVFPDLACVEVEYSMIERAPLTNGVNDACRDLGIPIVAYSPLGRGYLTGSIRSAADIPDGDLRNYESRLGSDENIKANFAIVQVALDLAEKKKCTPAQIALSWIRKHNDFPEKYATFIPIPSASSAKRNHENNTCVELTDGEFAAINKVLDSVTVQGDRYPAQAMEFLEA